MYEQLIREFIPDPTPTEGPDSGTQQSSLGELTGMLLRKLGEEFFELRNALVSGNKDAVLAELADLQTALDDLATSQGVSRRELDRAVWHKRRELGGFRRSLFLNEDRPPRARLHVGGGDSLLDALKHELLYCTRARFAVAFVMQSGVDLMEGALRAALLRGAELRFLTTDYLDITEPQALERLLHWPGRFEVRVFSQPGRSFHPKAYWFEHADGSGRAFIGSANFSRSGLRDGIEWTWSVLDMDPGQPMEEIRARFDELFDHPHAHPLSEQWLQAYRERRRPRIVSPEPAQPIAIAPRPVQSLALRELQRLRADGHRRGLVIAATGLGKTFLAAFDAAGADKVLFVAHREELLHQAAKAFAAVYPERSQGFVLDGRLELEADVVFASVQSLSQGKHLRRPELKRFDYVVIDEFHHAASTSYQRLIGALQPRFLLGLTATPYRGDNRDLISICDGNIAYQIGLFEAISFGWLVPFRYFGVADNVEYTRDLLSRGDCYDAKKLTTALNTDRRAQLVIDKFNAHPSTAALGFCVSIAHADFMAEAFRRAGIAAVAVHSGPEAAERQASIERLGKELRVIFTVDLFNEGVDIPQVDLVMFLRPTESMTVFLQQLGRGLRLSDDKAQLTVLDFIANYKRAHYKLPFLAGLEAGGPDEARAALKLLSAWISGGKRPPALPEGIEIELEPVALEALRKSLKADTMLRDLLCQDLNELRDFLGRPPTLPELYRLGRYGLATARNVLKVKSWNGVLQAVGMLDETGSALEREVGEFLTELETTAMTKSFKMVVLLAMLEDGGFRREIHLSELVAYFKRYLSEAGHFADIMGTDVEDPAQASATRWGGYLRGNPIKAWAGGKYFEWDQEREILGYVGPVAGNEEAFATAVRERVEFRLAQYWGHPAAGQMVFPVIPAGDKLCIMFGKGESRRGLPMGWQPVRINGKYLYGKFVKVALNVLKDQPTDSREESNTLTDELKALFEGRRAARMRVKLVSGAGEKSWEIVVA